MAEKANEPDGLISLEQAGRLLKLTPERIRQLMKEGYIPRDKPGRVLMVAAVQGYIQFLKDTASKKTKTATDQRVQNARAAEIEMRNAERLRKLVPIDDAVASLDYLAGVVGQQLAGLPARVTRDMDLRRRVEKEVNATQEAIAKALTASADAVAAGGDLPYASTADDA